MSRLCQPRAFAWRSETTKTLPAVLTLSGNSNAPAGTLGALAVPWNWAWQSLAEAHSRAGIRTGEFMDVICPCNNCSEHLEFDESAAGSTIACPHCGMDTVLFIPQVPVGAPPVEQEPAPKPKPKTAKIVEHELTIAIDKGGVEERLDKAGELFWVLGVLGGFCGLAAALFFLLSENQMTLAGGCCIVAIAAYAQGCIVNTLFKAGAEIIRLLKKANELKFSGKISEPTGTQLVYMCSACGATVSASGTNCPKCGVAFEGGLVKVTAHPSSPAQ